MSTDVSSIRPQFKELNQKVRGHDLVYLDNAASTLMPEVVINVMSEFDRTLKANVHRGAHFIADEATIKFENARKTVADFINAKSPNEIIFTRNTTESINLVAYTFVRKNLKAGNEILLTEMEHHSNIVPWQMMAKEVGAKVKYIPVLPNGDLDLKTAETLISDKTKMVAFTYCSNAIGTINPVQKIVSMVRAKSKAKVLIDAAQAMTMLPVDVQKIDCDFLAFSGHKVFGPFGIGVLYGKEDLLNSIPPFLGGGSMIAEVNLEESTYLQSPQRFEAGTPNVTGAVGLAEALNFISNLGVGKTFEHEKGLLKLATEEAKKIKGFRVIGESQEKANILSFVFDGAHHSDVGNILDQQGVAIRAGHHCAQPLMRKYGIQGTARASFSVYNNEGDVERFIAGLKKAKEMLT